MVPRVRFAILFAAALVAPRSGRAGDEDDPGDLRAAVRPLVVGSADLGCELHRVLAEPGGNSVLSPLSVTLALALVREGALGETADEMDRVFHLRMADLGGAVRRLREALEREEDSLRVANGLWHRADSPLKRAYLRRVLEAHGVEPRAFDPGRIDAAVDEVNRWVAERTRGRVRDLLAPDAIGRAPEAVLVNAVAFRAAWRRPFEASATRPRPFSPAPGVEAQVATMAAVGRFRWGSTDDARVLEVPYRGDAFSLLVVVPTARHGLAALERRLSSSQLAAWADAARPRSVAVALPRFSFGARAGLGPALRALGARAVFAGGFHGISDGSFRVGDVLHAADVAVEEAGTAAAAATAVAVLRGGNDDDEGEFVEFRADEPFLFVLRHRPTDAVLFLGRVADPSKSR